jgi:hypothetical protein
MLADQMDIRFFLTRRARALSIPAARLAAIKEATMTRKAMLAAAILAMGLLSRLA